MEWKKTGRAVDKNGTTITYEAAGCPATIESRKRHIPHANREGTWDHTSYFVIHRGQEVAEKYSLRDAKEYVEEHYGRREN